MQKRLEERKTVMRRPTQVSTPQLRRATAPTRGRRRAILSRTPEACSRPCLPSVLGLFFVFWSIIYCGRRRREATSQFEVFKVAIAELPEKPLEEKGSTTAGVGANLGVEERVDLATATNTDRKLRAARGDGLDAAKINLLFSSYPLVHLAYDWRKRDLLVGPTWVAEFLIGVGSGCRL